MTAAAWTAPAGFLRLGDTATRFAERLRSSRQKAEYRVAREISEGRLRMLALAGLELLTAGEGLRLDFAASEAVGLAEDRQVIHLHLGEGGPGGVLMAAVPRGERVVVDEDDVERLLIELAPTREPAAPVSPYQPPGQSPATGGAPRRPGRPAQYDWPWYEQQARRRVAQYGLPEKSSILVFELADLFSRKVEDPPEQRTVEREVAKWWPELERLAQEDLNGPCEIKPKVVRDATDRSVAP